MERRLNEIATAWAELAHQLPTSSYYVEAENLTGALVSAVYLLEPGHNTCLRVTPRRETPLGCHLSSKLGVQFI